MIKFLGLMGRGPVADMVRSAFHRSGIAAEQANAPDAHQASLSWPLNVGAGDWRR